VITRPANKITHTPQQDAAVDTPVLRIARREMPADITQRSRTQQGIAQRMQHDVAVRVSRQPRVMRDLDTTEHQSPAGLKGMGIDALSDPYHGSRFSR
jgi:hypothetical protein